MDITYPLLLTPCDFSLPNQTPLGHRKDTRLQVLLLLFLSFKPWLCRVRIILGAVLSKFLLLKDGIGLYFNLMDS